MTVPIIMYHSVGIVDKDWAWNYLTCPYEVFEDQLRWLKKKGFRSVTLSRLYENMAKGEQSGERVIALTFDDGYLDNWTFVFPLLMNYGFNGTFFISPEFVDPCESVRPTLGDFWAGRAELDELPKVGFMSWPELRAMAGDGQAEIQSHALSHTWYPKGSRIMDFRHPGDGYIWMTWNRHPGKKPFLQKDDPRLIEWGAPVYEHAKSLEARRYYPDPGLDRFLVDHVRNNGGEGFFMGDWRTALFQKVKEYTSEHSLEGRSETKAEYEDRIRYELRQSKEAIQEHLGTSVMLLCWPGGGISDIALRIAKEEGYVASTYTSREVRSQNHGKKTKDESFRFRRIGASLYGSGQAGKASQAIYLSGFLFILRLHLFQGKQPLAFLSRVILGICKKFNQFRKAI